MSCDKYYGVYKSLVKFIKRSNIEQGESEGEFLKEKKKGERIGKKKSND